MKVFLLRHGRTKGNLEQRYVGRTEESVLPAELARLARWARPAEPDLLYVSPRRRCLETAEALFPGCAATVVEDFRECDFGEFENHNYLELSGNPAYQAWIDSNATLPFPGGDSRESFRQKSFLGLRLVLEKCDLEGIRRAAVVTHGGTIMNLMEAYAEEKKDYYSWHVKNGCGYYITTEIKEPEGLVFRIRKNLP